MSDLGAAERVEAEPSSSSAGVDESEEPTAGAEITY